jgi:aspartyl-tRNA(Asn)/glutamyl-tRNA(Gln) amidotransferase subunit A
MATASSKVRFIGRAWSHRENPAQCHTSQTAIACALFLSETGAMDSIAKLSRALADSSTTSAALVDASLARIGAVDDQIGAFLEVDADGARAQSKASDARRSRGEVLSPVDGIPIAIKDNIACEGARLTAGSKILEGYRAPYDATVVRKLKAAGAVIVGRTNLDEFGMGSSTENSAYALTRNPWDTTRIPGGSSGGSAAAVAASMVAGALASDTGGSIRQPASMCGVVGIKPSYGRVSRFGLVAFASSLDVIGPIAGDVESAAMLLEVIAGKDERDSTSVDATLARGLLGGAQSAASAVAAPTVGVPRAFFGAGLASEVRGAIDEAERALRSSGARVVDVDLPHADAAVATYYVLCTAEASSNLARFDGVRYGQRRGDEKNLASMYAETRALFGDEVKRRIVLGSWVLSAGYYDAYVRRAQRVRALVARDFASAFDKCDVILLPNAPEAAWKIGDKSNDPLAMYLADVYTVPASLAGLPAISLPVAFTSTGLPIGAQLVGRSFDEITLLRAALALEKTIALPERKLPL